MMSKIEELMQELDQEALSTRRVLERVPGDRLGWKPHDKSMSLGQLALHVATIPGGIAEISRKSPFPVPQFAHQGATSAAELIPALPADLRVNCRKMSSRSVSTVERSAISSPASSPSRRRRTGLARASASWPRSTRRCSTRAAPSTS